MARQQAVLPVVDGICLRAACCTTGTVGISAQRAGWKWWPFLSCRRNITPVKYEGMCEILVYTLMYGFYEKTTIINYLWYVVDCCECHFTYCCHYNDNFLLYILFCFVALLTTKLIIYLHGKCSFYARPRKKKLQEYRQKEDHKLYTKHKHKTARDLQFNVQMYL